MNISISAPGTDSLRVRNRSKPGGTEPGIMQDGSVKTPGLGFQHSRHSENQSMQNSLSVSISFRLYHLPPVKSGNTTGAPPFRIDSSLSGVIAIRTAVS